MNRGMEKFEARSRVAVPPRVDVFESEAELLLKIDVPGVARDAVDVRFDDGQLVIEAKREIAPKGTLLAEEWSPRDFHRAFAIPDGVDLEKVDAKLEGGVLELRLPKEPAKRARRIDVRGS